MDAICQGCEKKADDGFNSGELTYHYLYKAPKCRFLPSSEMSNMIPPTQASVWMKIIKTEKS